MTKRFLPTAGEPGSADESPALVRRSFLLGCAACGVAACSGATATHTDDAGAGDDGGAGDDASTDGGDGGDGGASMCPSTAKDTGKMPSAFAAGKPVYLASAFAFVVRDAGGLYALTAVCTHQGCTCTASGNGFYCPCHGATFDLSGNVTLGPARLPLKHYALCITGNGTVAIDTKTTVAASTRYPF